MSTDKNNEAATSRKEIKSAMHHMAEGADEALDAIYNTAFGNFGRTNATVFVSAVTGLGAATVFGLSAFPAVFAAAVAPIGVAIGGGVAGVTGVEASKHTKLYKDELSPDAASRWSTTGKCLGVAFALAGGIVVNMGIYGSLVDCQTEANIKQAEEKKESIGHKVVKTDYRLRKAFDSTRNNEVNDNKTYIELSAVHHGNVITLKV